ncbi:DMT family transporter [Variovorax arabinosiphilus]|uniref:DMT family transporter n=1 Tax=Variovorax arabinosiphilus TaxID=3053498 RepID=UPI002577D77A|nr:MULTISPECIES: DMT family transporter [unclassified Variovorax]MDM0122319.1 DMT family transporter [Variovorax sp. J2L1-78]MDM0131152.1 DMT family transporter [Variovorax sp. J2L1-63]MDM0235082.1 DMT family transporter [Variovorax sp. J2R1-6]
MSEARGDPSTLRTIALTAAAMVAFAANSLLCRLALQHRGIDPASFGSIRLVSGAITLALVVRLRAQPSSPGRAGWLAAVMLFAYVAFFSFAYLSLTAGTGALILFGAVQLTMLGAGLGAGERFGPVAWFGFVLAAGGLVYLVSPGIAAPPLLGAVLMAVAGVAWGVYSLRGRGVADPLAATARNFTRAVPLALALSLVFVASAHADATGVALAVASGALTSGLGYVVWYAALARLSAMQAATVQLSVPLLAAFGGVLLLSEAITPRLAAASVAILGGIALVLSQKSRNARG